MVRGRTRKAESAGGLKGDRHGRSGEEESWTGGKMLSSVEAASDCSLPRETHTPDLGRPATPDHNSPLFSHSILPEECNYVIVIMGVSVCNIDAWNVSTP